MLQICLKNCQKSIKLHFFEIFFFSKTCFEPQALVNENFQSKPKNSKSLNILEHFWYPGHFCSSKTKKIKEVYKVGTKL